MKMRRILSSILMMFGFQVSLNAILSPRVAERTSQENRGRFRQKRERQPNVVDADTLLAVQTDEHHLE